MGVSMACNAACSISGQIQWLESRSYNELKSPAMRLLHLCCWFFFFFLELPRNGCSVTLSACKCQLTWGKWVRGRCFQEDQGPSGLTPSPLFSFYDAGRGNRTATFSFDSRDLALTCGWAVSVMLEGTRALESDTAELRSWSFVSCVAVSLLLNLSESQFHLLTSWM